MYSQCPDCTTRFRVTAAHLRAAGGTVRCGRCGAAFDALATLTDTLQGPEAATLALAAGAIQPLADDATPAGAYHFSADDLERVFIDARDWHRQFGKSAPIAEPDEVAEAARLAAATAATSGHSEDTRTQSMPTPDDFESPAWAAGIEDGDLESTQPLPILRNVPEARLFEDEDLADGPADASVGGPVETGAVEPSGAELAASLAAEDSAELAEDRREWIDEGGYVPAQVEPEVEAIFEHAPEPLTDIDVTLEPLPADGEPATPLDVELDLAAVDIEFEEFEPGTDGTPATVDVELQPAPADGEPAIPLDVELGPADETVVEPLLTEPARPEEAALVASYELLDERVPWPPPSSPEQIVPSGLEVAPAHTSAPIVVPEPEIWTAPADSRAEPAVAAAGAVAVAVAHGSAADLPLGSGRWRRTREAEAELDTLDDTSEDERSPFPWGWALGCLLLLLALGAQVVHQYRDTLLRDPRVGPLIGPLVNEAYARLGRPLAPLADPTSFELRQEGNVADSRPGTLHVRASITNQASFAQAPPLLRVSLEDRFGNAVAVRDFAPADYLPEGATAPASLAVGEKIAVDLLLLDPGGDAVGFQLRPCVPDESPGRLRCEP
jgi:predicted Zn finger-like uncharacterized protein